MSGRSLRIGVVGAGYWGPNLVRNCAALGVLDSVCDSNSTTLKIVGRDFPGVALIDDYDRLLQRPIDGVIIASPASLHATMALKAIAHKKHIFVEKPLALTVSDGEMVERSARAAGVQAFVGHLLLYHPAVRKLRRVLAEGAIGQIWHIRSRRLSLGKLRAQENAWWSFAPHDVAIMLALAQAEPVAASSSMTCIRGSQPCDLAYVDFTFANGSSAHIEVGWLDPNKTAQLDVFGTRGVLTLRDSRDGANLTLQSCGILGDPESSLELLRTDPVTVDFEPGEPLRLELESFLECIETRSPPESDASQGVAVLKALTLAENSARLNLFKKEMATL